MKFRIILLAISLGLSGTSLAGTIACPGAVSGNQRFVELTTVGADAQCLLASGGNLTGNPMNDPFLLANSNFVTIDKSDDAVSGTDVDAFGSNEVQGLNEGTQGSFDFSSVAGSYLQFAIGFKTGGNGNQDNVSFVFLLPAGITSGIWEIMIKNQELSHAVLYGVPAPVPIPAAAWLFLTAVGGLFGIRKARANRVFKANLS